MIPWQVFTGVRGIFYASSLIRVFFFFASHRRSLPSHRFCFLALSFGPFQLTILFTGGCFDRAGLSDFYLKFFFLIMSSLVGVTPTTGGFSVVLLREPSTSLDGLQAGPTFRAISTSGPTSGPPSDLTFGPTSGPTIGPTSGLTFGPNSSGHPSGRNGTKVRRYFFGDGEFLKAGLMLGTERRFLCLEIFLRFGDPSRPRNPTMSKRLP